MKIGSPTNFWGGVMFAVIGITFALIAYGLKLGDKVILSGYAMGTPARMGPAFFPFYLGLILAAIGVTLAVIGLRGEGAKVEKFQWKAIGFVLGAVCLFGFTMKLIGMPLAGMLLVIVASLGSHDFKWRPVIFLGIGLVIFCTGVFVYGLKLPIPLCPALDALQELRMCRV